MGLIKIFSNSMFQIQINEQKLHHSLIQIEDKVQKLKNLADCQAQTIDKLNSKCHTLDQQLKNITANLKQKLSEQAQKQSLAIANVELLCAKSAENSEQEFRKIKQENQKTAFDIGEKILKMTQQIEETRSNKRIQSQNAKENETETLIKNTCFQEALQKLVHQQIENKRKKSCVFQQKQLLDIQCQKQQLGHNLYLNLRKDIDATQDVLKKLKIKFNKNIEKQKRKYSQELPNLQYGLLTSKINELQKKLEGNKFLFEQKVLYPSQKPTCKQSKENQSSSPSIEIFEKYHKQIFAKMGMIEQNVAENFKQLENKILDMNDESKEIRNQIRDQKQLCLKKFLNKFEYLKLQILKINENHLQNNGLKEIYQTIHKMEQRLEQSLAKKVEKEQVKKFEESMERKMIIFKQKLQQKSNKDEIKKAIIFLEQKIKEIVVILVELQRKNCGTAGTKTKLIQCLSCNSSYLDEFQTVSKGSMKRCNTARTFRKHQTKCQSLLTKR